MLIPGLVPTNTGRGPRWGTCKLCAAPNSGEGQIGCASPCCHERPGPPSGDTRAAAHLQSTRAALAPSAESRSGADPTWPLLWDPGFRHPRLGRGQVDTDRACQDLWRAANRVWLPVAHDQRRFAAVPPGARESYGGPPAAPGRRRAIPSWQNRRNRCGRGRFDGCTRHAQWCRGRVRSPLPSQGSDRQWHSHGVEQHHDVTAVAWSQQNKKNRCIS